MERVEAHYSPSRGNGKQLNHSCLCLAHLEVGGGGEVGGRGGEVGGRGGGGEGRWGGGEVGEGRGEEHSYRYTTLVIKLLLYS